MDCVVHGDDFTFCGEDEALDWIEKSMKEWFEVKIRARLGEDDKDDKEVTLLGRIIRWKAWGGRMPGRPQTSKVGDGGFGAGRWSEGVEVQWREG